MVQYRRLRAGGAGHVRYGGPQRGDWPRHRRLGLLDAEGDSLRPPALSRIPGGGVQPAESPELGRTERDALERGIRPHQYDARRHASDPDWCEADLLISAKVVWRSLWLLNMVRCSA